MDIVKKAVKNALNELAGVIKVEVDLSTKTVEVEGESLDGTLIKDAIEDAGYDLIEIK